MNKYKNLFFTFSILVSFNMFAMQQGENVPKESSIDSACSCFMSTVCCMGAGCCLVSPVIGLFSGIVSGYYKNIQPVSPILLSKRDIHKISTDLLCYVLGLNENLKKLQ